MLIKSKQLGSAVIQVLFSVALVSTIGLTIIDQTKNNAALNSSKVTGEHYKMVIVAARQFHQIEGEWPSSVNDLTARGLLSAKHSKTPSGGSYLFSSLDGGDKLGISFTVPTSAEIEQILLYGLPNVTRSGNTITTRVPPIQNTLSLNEFYKLDGTTPMVGNLDVNNNDLYGANIVSPVTKLETNNATLDQLIATQRIESNRLISDRVMLGASGYYIEPSGITNVRSVTTNATTANIAEFSSELRASRFVSFNNPNYYLDPSATSRLNIITAPKVYTQSTTTNTIEATTLNATGSVDVSGRTTTQRANLASIYAQDTIAADVIDLGNNYLMASIGRSGTSPYYISSGDFKINNVDSFEYNAANAQITEVTATDSINISWLFMANEMHSTNYFTQNLYTDGGFVNRLTTSALNVTNSFDVRGILNVRGNTTFNGNTNLSGTFYAERINANEAHFSETVSSGNTIISGDIKAQDNNNFSLRLSQTSKLSQLNTNELSLGVASSIGSACPSNGMGVNQSGDLLVCKAGRWSNLVASSTSDKSYLRKWGNSGEYEAVWEGHKIQIRSGRAISGNSNTTIVNLTKPFPANTASWICRGSFANGTRNIGLPISCRKPNNNQIEFDVFNYSGIFDYFIIVFAT